MRQQLKLFLTAVQFFTRITVPSWVGHKTPELNQSARYLPLVGLFVGGISALVMGVSSLFLTAPVSLLFGMLASILLTGGFHEDGLSDFVDGIGGGYTREKILSIMKDSRVGVFGAIAIVFVLMIKFQLLLAIISYHSIIFAGVALIAAHSISRMLAISIMLTQVYVRVDDSARAKPVALGLSRTSFVIALLTGISSVGLLFLAGSRVESILSAVFCALLLRIYLGRLMHQKIGGYTGDCLGAVQQITEIGFYTGLIIA